MINLDMDFLSEDTFRFVVNRLKNIVITVTILPR